MVKEEDVEKRVLRNKWCERNAGGGNEKGKWLRLNQAPQRD